ncbi:hypothetical protein B0I37DRAFT_365501 [Chaetomium sp. MPI-CAGE-AT-0009]|nr:hypothetical protein B0I37DRAFT_365501 [Chaetomium sp. MPI-CAGE-AT-0009]
MRWRLARRQHCSSNCSLFPPRPATLHIPHLSCRIRQLLTWLAPGKVVFDGWHETATNDRRGLRKKCSAGRDRDFEGLHRWLQRSRKSDTSDLARRTNMGAKCGRAAAVEIPLRRFVSLQGSSWTARKRLKLRDIRREWRAWLFSRTNPAMDLQQVVALMIHSRLGRRLHSQIDHRTMRSCALIRGCLAVRVEKWTSVRGHRSEIHGNSGS